MMNAVVLQLAILLCVCKLRNVKAALGECTFGYFRCADNSKCVSDHQLCDYKRDCDDLSDERLSMCQLLHALKQCRCDRPGLVYVQSSCIPISQVCSEKRTGVQQKLCNELEDGLKPSEEFSALRDEKNRFEESFRLLAISYNKTDWPKEGKNCPPLYVYVFDKCVAPFLPVKVTWAEAKHFCKSISGQLAIINKMEDYEALLSHLKINAIESNFWIGGQYESHTSSWNWLDSSQIELGARFWSVYYSGGCKVRKNSDHCYVYEIFPKENTDGYCLSMDYEFHYYFSDRNCLEKRSPICYLN